jgi:hypothetical protein
VHHPAMNAEIARLAHADALRAVPPAPGEPEPEPEHAAPGPISRLATMLLPELPVELRWPRGSVAEPGR